MTTATTDALDLDQDLRRRLEAVSSAQPAFWEVATSYEQQDARIVAAIRSSATDADRPIRILEAGCGNKWALDLGDLKYRLVGVDLDAAAMNLRIQHQKDLHEAIVGDLCTVALPKGEFDVVYSAYVLEHIERADLALDNLVSSLRPGGLMVLRLPDPESARGFVTRVTPFWFHVMFARYVERRPHAGEPGFAPYPTYYHPSIWRDSLLKLGQRHGLHCLWCITDDFAREGKGPLAFIERTGAMAVSLLSFGRYHSRFNNVTYILRKAA